MDSAGTAFRRLIQPFPAEDIRSRVRVPLAQVGRRGCLDLTFVLQNGRTVLQNAYCEIPFKITRVLNTWRPVAHLILMQSTAGLFGGDEVEFMLRVESGAQVLLTQQSATKVHPSGDRPAIQTTRVFVEAGAELHIYLEPVIPFAESCLRQSTHIDVARGARLVFWEGLMAGRVGRQERWQFREFASETQLRVDSHLVFLDRFLLQPDGSQCSPFVMGGCNYAGTGLYVGDQADTFATSLHEALPGVGVDTPVPGVAVTRVVSVTGPDFHRNREVFSRLLSDSYSFRRLAPDVE